MKWKGNCQIKMLEIILQFKKAELTYNKKYNFNKLKQNKLK